MRFESSVTSVSWIPSEAITGMTRLPLDMGIGRYDDPPPDSIDDLVALRDAGRFRFANELRSWVEVTHGRIVAAGYSGGGLICPTELSLGVGKVSVPPVAMPDIQDEPVVSDDEVVFRQTTGGRTGAPLPRRVNRPPFVRLTAPWVWTTLELRIRADGSSDSRVAGASKMPRHWIYDSAGRLAAKSGNIDFKTWTKQRSGEETPWGASDSPALITEAETVLERELSAQVMRAGKKPRIQKVSPGTELVTQGSFGTHMFLVLDGVLTVEVDGTPVAEMGPGAVLGERAVLEGGTRTSTLRAVTPLKVAVTDAESIDRRALERLAEGRRREDGLAAAGREKEAR